MQFSVILGVYKDCLSVETRETRHIVGRRASVCATRFFHRRRIKFAFFGCGYLSGMEGDGDLMKMLMHADPPDENIQGPMEDTAMVQTGVWVEHLLLIFGWLVVSHAGKARMCVDRNNTIFDGFKADASITDLCLCAEATKMLLPWIMQVVFCLIEGGGSPFITTWCLYFRVDPFSWYDVEVNNHSYTVERNSTGCD